ncbi:MAG TPA: maleylpyruvate isomerase family mycothiol-dependent enzyme [Acidimicrobiales bacterium]
MTPEQWSALSWCDGWSVKKVAGHVVAAAEQTIPNFYKEFISAGMKFNVFAERGADAVAVASTEQMVARLRACVTTTNHPPAPVMAMLGEIVVHGEDIRRPLAMVHHSPEEALVAVADSWKNSNLLIGAKRRITDIQLKATDATWQHGDGARVEGPLQSLILAMTGRKRAHVDLTGEGIAVLAGRP